MTSIKEFFEAIKKQDAIETDHNGLMEIDRRYIYDILLENLENELKDEEYTDW